MTDQFDPYHRWLGIPPKYQPADHYRLLGLERFEDDPEVIVGNEAKDYVALDEGAGFARLVSAALSG